jgi:hypothetical protein
MILFDCVRISIRNNIRFSTIEMFVVVFVRAIINRRHVLNHSFVRCLWDWTTVGIKFNSICRISLDVPTERITLKHWEFKYCFTTYIEHVLVVSLLFRFLSTLLDSCQLSNSTCLLFWSTLFGRWIAAGIQTLFTGRNISIDSIVNIYDVRLLSRFKRNDHTRKFII